MSQLGTGIIGLGIGEQHIAGFRRPPTCDVDVLCDLSEEKLSCVAERYPHCRRTTHWRELLDDDKIDIISIASFDDAHFEQTVAAIQARKHVFVEKPMCRSMLELTVIKQTLIRQPDLNLSSNLVLRAAPIYVWLREAIQSGKLGQIYAIDGEYLYGRIHKITEGWRKDVPDYSVMQGGGVHLADLILWLTGEKPLAVVASGNGICTEGTAFQPNDFVASAFQFPSGMTGRLTANFGCVHPHHHILRAFGTKATFLYDDQGPRLFTSRDPDRPPERLEHATLPAAKWDLIPEFVEDVLNGKNQIERSQREFDTISVCLAADEALRCGEKVEVKYV